MFCRLSDRFGWTFDQIGEMTWPQVLACFEYMKRQPAPWVFMGSPKE